MLAAGGRAFGDEGDVGGGDFDDFGEGAEGEGKATTDVEADVVDGNRLEPVATGREGGGVVDAGLDGGGFGGGDGGGRYCLGFTRRGRG